MAAHLIPVFIGNLHQDSIHLCNARNLHTSLKVRRDFSTWITGRIEEYGFVEGEDFIIVEVLSSPKSGSSKARKQTMIDYHLTLDMAKELAMVENNEIGRQVRRYFIRVEQELMAELRDKARHILSLPGIKIKSVRAGMNLKQTLILQKQGRELMALLLAETAAPQCFNLHCQLRQVNDALGIPTDTLAEITTALPNLSQRREG